MFEHAAKTDLTLKLLTLRFMKKFHQPNDEFRAYPEKEKKNGNQKMKWISLSWVVAHRTPAQPHKSQPPSNRQPAPAAGLKEAVICVAVPVCDGPRPTIDLSISFFGFHFFSLFLDMPWIHHLVDEIFSWIGVSEAWVLDLSLLHAQTFCAD